MKPSHWLRFVVLVAAILGAQVLLAVPASAHKHPTPVELDSPGVVYVETTARVEVSIIEHYQQQDVTPHVQVHPHESTPLLATASGFAVDPTGDIVTSGDAISADRKVTPALLKRAEIYAVNQAFKEQYGLPTPSDPFSTYRARDDVINSRLQQCYTRKNTANEEGGCVIATSWQITVYPYVTSQVKYGALPAIPVGFRSTPAGPIAVLKVNGSTLPTVYTAPSAAGAKALSVLGFTGRPDAAHPLKKVDGHLSAPGSSQLSQVKGKGKDAGKGEGDSTPAVAAAVRAGLVGGPVVGEAGQVVGFLYARRAQSGQSAPAPQLVRAEEIRLALKAAGVTPEVGPTYAAYEEASHNFKNRLFLAAVPGLKKTLGFYPGHYRATQDLLRAEKLQNTSADLTGKSSPGTTRVNSSTGANLSGTRLVAWLLAAVALVAIGVIVFLLWRRRSPPGKDPRPAASPVRPSPAGAPTASRPAPDRESAGSGGDGGGRVPPARGNPSAVALPVATATAEARPPRPDTRSSPAAPVDGVTSGPSISGPANSSPSMRGSDASAAARSGAPPPPDAHQRFSVMSPRDEVKSEGSSASEVSRQAYCTNCGRQATAHHHFCGWCGNVLG